MMRLPLMFMLVLSFVFSILAQNAKEKTTAETIRIEADPSKGFSYPYYLFIPGSFRAIGSHNQPQTILVMPNNSGRISDDLDFHEKSVKTKMFQAALVFGKLNVAILMPVFPRPETDWKIYTQALDRDSLTTDKKEFKRFDVQLVKMIDHARTNFAKEKIKTDERVLIYGYSASGMFANRFTFLHPERVKAAAIGSPGGWAIAPAATYNTKTLPYPIGVGDLREISGREFNLKELQKVRLFVFVGDKDANDSVVFRDGYEEADEKLILELFGKTPLERWEISKRLYEDQKLRATFRLYEGIEHKVTVEMLADVVAFLEEYK